MARLVTRHQPSDLALQEPLPSDNASSPEPPTYMTLRRRMPLRGFLPRKLLGLPLFFLPDVGYLCQRGCDAGLLLCSFA